MLLVLLLLVTTTVTSHGRLIAGPLVALDAMAASESYHDDDDDCYTESDSPGLDAADSDCAGHFKFHSRASRHSSHKSNSSSVPLRARQVSS